MLANKAGRFCALLALLYALPLAAFANDSIDSRINAAVQPWADRVSGLIFSAFPVAGVDVPFVLVWLLFAAVLFTFYFRFINLRAFRHGFQLVRGDYNDPLAAGEVTHFQALATALWQSVVRYNH